MPGISLLTKNVTKLLHPWGMDCSPFPWTFMGNPGDGEKSYATAKNLLISPIRKNPPNRFKSFAVKSFISSPTNINFQVMKMQSSFVAAVISVVSYFNFMYTHVMLIWLNVYWMLPWAWQKHRIIESLPSKISIPSTFPFPPSLQCYFENLLLLLLVFLFFTLPFLHPTL